MILLLSMFLSFGGFNVCDAIRGPVRIEKGDTYLICKSKPPIVYGIYSRLYWDYTYRYGEGEDSVEYIMSTKRRSEITKMYEVVDSVVVPKVYIVMNGKKWYLHCNVLYPAWHYQEEKK